MATAVPTEVQTLTGYHYFGEPVYFNRINLLNTFGAVLEGFGTKMEQCPTPTWSTQCTVELIYLLAVCRLAKLAKYKNLFLWTCTVSLPHISALTPPLYFSSSLWLRSLWHVLVTCALEANSWGGDNKGAAGYRARLVLSVQLLLRTSEANLKKNSILYQGYRLTSIRCCLLKSGIFFIQGSLLEWLVWVNKVKRKTLSGNLWHPWWLSSALRAC